MVHIKDTTVPRKILLAVAFTSVLFTSSVPVLWSQDRRSDPPPLRERLFFGGDFGLQFGTYTNIEISPVVGLWVLPRLAIAAGPEYKYYAQKNIGSTAIYGGRGYTQFTVIQDLNNIIPLGLHFGLYLHAEDEFQSLQSDTPFWTNTQVETDRFTVNAVLVGGGISQPMGRRSSLNMTVLWALDDIYDIYSSPEIRVSFIF